jgi:membrane dipeptidase
VDHVAFGSDFDGAAVPDSIHNAAGLQKLVSALASNGFSESELAGMAHGNWQRVLRETWRE